MTYLLFNDAGIHKVSRKTFYGRKTAIERASNDEWIRVLRETAEVERKIARLNAGSLMYQQNIYEPTRILR